MPSIYEICGDEAWTHTNGALNRYLCFFGGLLCLENEADRLETDLRRVLGRRGHRQEIKWSNLSPIHLSIYKELVDLLFDHLLSRQVRFRQIFLDRQFVYIPPVGEPAVSDLDLQFKICYQFLKHSFGLKYLPAAASGPDKVLIRLDTHSSQKHKSALRGFVELQLPKALGRSDLVIELAHVASHHLHRIGVCDVLMGAAGSYGNRQQLRRKPGARGMNDRQIARLDLSKYIFGKLRNLNEKDRGGHAFNWFESTGTDGDPANTYRHKLRIWKFRPKDYAIDKGWQNDHLDAQGRYQGPEIVPVDP